MMLCLALIGCAQQTTVPTSRSVTVPTAPDTTPASPLVDVGPQAGDTADSEAVTIEGTDRLIGPTRSVRSSVETSENGIELNFVEAGIADVVQTVIGVGLGLPYVLDPGVSGTLTLQSTQPLTQDGALTALEAALRLNDAAMINVDGVWQIVPITDATRRVTEFRSAAARRPGYGVYVVPLRFITPSAMDQVLEPFAPPGGILRTDDSRNLLVLGGTNQEVTSMLELVRLFDVDWLDGMSFGLYPVQYVDAETVALELSEVFSAADSPITGIVRFVPLARLNSLMVVTPRAEYLDEVESWIRRLDLGTSSPGRRIYVYDVQNARANDLADSLSEILSIGADTISGGSFPVETGQSSGSITTPTTDDSSMLGSGGLKIVPNSENNSLLILATPAEFTVIEATLKRVDVLPIQVLIEASVAEVMLSDDLRWGLQWSSVRSTGEFVLSDSASGAISQEFPGFSYLYTGSDSIRAVLNAIESQTTVNVLSAPKLLVLNNHEAQLQIGAQVPVATQSAVSIQDSDAPIVNSVEFRDTGVILTVTPRANQSGRVIIDIAQEVSDVSQTTTSGIDSPTIQQRRFSSTVAVMDGETIAIGGLIRETNTRTRSGIPVLSRLPGVGGLFGSRNRDNRRTELIVLLTPRVIRSEDESQRVMDEMRRQFEGLRPVLDSESSVSVEVVPQQPDERDAEP
jgi:general secretion pathway protein D